MTLPQPLPAMALGLPASLGALVRLLLERPDLQDQLGAILAADAFAAEALAVAAEHGVACDAEALRAVLRPDPLGLGRFAAAPVALDGWPPPGWLPTRSVPTGDAPAFDWLWFGSRRLDAPFFEDEVRRASALPLNWLLRIRTGLRDLVKGAPAEPEPPLSGLVFHLSRCGSTLLAQMLGALPGHTVSSEPEPLDAVLRWTAAARPDPAESSAAIRAMVAALGRPRHPAPRHFIKLEVWHTLFLPQLRAAFPAVNWVYLHRDPAEVLVSLAAQPSMHILPGALDPALLGIDPAQAEGPDDHAAMVLHAAMRAVIDHWPLGGGLAVDYPEIPAAATGAIAAHFGLELDSAARARMAAAAQRDAKAPERPFAADRAAKQAEATDSIRRAAAQWLDPLRQQLAQKR
ncbi:MAG TPA: hypothetical protein VFV30_08325 [Novosphingobium sp.]|nr:hypothetical protein [Novosphingobium sp.]